MDEFTKQQKQILAIGRRKGFVTLQDFIIVYSSPISRKSNLERFMAMGILVESKVPGKFIFNNLIYKG